MFVQLQTKLNVLCLCAQIHYEVKKLHGPRCYISRQEASCALVSMLTEILGVVLLCSQDNEYFKTKAIWLRNVFTHISGFRSILTPFSFQPTMPVSPLPAVIQAEERQRTEILQNTHRTLKGLFPSSLKLFCECVTCISTECMMFFLLFSLTEFTE